MENHIMMEYIREEAVILRRLVKDRKELTAAFVKHLTTHTVKKIYFSGHGSPYHVGIIVKPMLEKLLSIEVSAEISALFNNHSGFNVNGVYKGGEQLLICPAQSGRTTGPYYAAVKARELGIPVLCLTLRPEGKLAKESDIVIVKDSGEEESFPETKGHLTSVALLMLCVLEAAYAMGKLSQEAYGEYMEAFERLPGACSRAVEATLVWYEKQKSVLMEEFCASIIGYGENYGTALEGAMKVQESTLKAWSGYECEEYMHGKNQAVLQNSVLFFLYAKVGGPETERMQQLVQWCRERSRHCFVVGKKGNPLEDETSICWEAVDHPYLSAIEYHIPFQVLSYKLATDMGLSTIVANHDFAGAQLKTRIEE